MLMMPARHHRGRPPRLDSTLKIIRDKTAFHYDRLNLTEAADIRPTRSTTLAPLSCFAPSSP